MANCVFLLDNLCLLQPKGSGTPSKNRIAVSCQLNLFSKNMLRPIALGPNDFPPPKRHKTEFGQGRDTALNATLICGIDCLARGDDKQAFQYLSEVAAIAKRENLKLNADPFVPLGNMYRDGRGTSQDYSKARACYQHAADFEISAAYAPLGMAYAKGEGVDRDVTQALSYAEKAIDCMHAQGWVVRGLANANSYAEPSDRGCEVDDFEDEENALRYRIAVDDFKKAANAENIDGWIYLGDMYMLGRGVARNNKEAMVCFQKAAAIDPLGAAKKLEQIHQHSVAYKIYEILAREGNPEALAKCGMMLKEGRGVDRDYRTAFLYLKKAAEQNVAIAYIPLGDLYSQGLGTMWSQKNAICLYTQAAEAGMLAAYGRLAAEHLTSYGQGHYDRNNIQLEMNSVEAAKNSLHAIELGDVQGYVGLGHVLVSDLYNDSENERSAVLEYCKQAMHMMDETTFPAGRRSYYETLVATHMKDKENLEDDSPVRFCLVAIAMGNSDGWVELGNWYWYSANSWMKPDEKQEKYRKALDCYDKAIAMGNWKGNSRKGTFFAVGGKDLAKAYDCFKLAAESGSPTGLGQFGYEFLIKLDDLHLGCATSDGYFNDDDRDQFYSDVVTGLQKASDMGDSEAMAVLGEIYLHITDVITQDIEKKIYGCFTKSYSWGNTALLENLISLADRYERDCDEVFQQNHEKAVICFRALLCMEPDWSSYPQIVDLGERLNLFGVQPATSGSV